MNKTKLKIKAIIVAGGYSRRLKSSVPKQLLKVNQKALVAHSLDVFEKCKAIKSIILVGQGKYLPHFKRLIKQYGYRKIECVCLGGATRQESVFSGLKQIQGCDYVIIHDGVRPFVTEKIILDVLNDAVTFGASAAAVRAKDTIVKARGNFINKTLLRDRLWHLQTPQGFKFKLIYQAHKHAKAIGISSASDDAQLLLKIKKKVKLTQGCYSNIKITTAFDLFLAQNMMKGRAG